MVNHARYIPRLETWVYKKRVFLVLGFKVFLRFLYEDRTRKYDPAANGLSKHRFLLKTNLQ